MSRRSLLLVLAVAILLIPSVHAKEAILDMGSNGSSGEGRDRMMEQVLSTKGVTTSKINTMIEKHDEMSDDTASKEAGMGRPNLGRVVSAMHHDLRQEFASREAEFKDRVAQMKEIFKKQHDEFKTKISEIKDARKKIIVENVDTNLQTINASRTTTMTEALSRMTTILQQLQTKLDAANAAGQDTTQAQSAIDSAKTAIATAQSTVASQSSKSYSGTITDDASVKGAVSAAFKSLQTDLKTTEAAVMQARKAVADAARELYKLKQSHESNSTGSATTQ